MKIIEVGIKNWMIIKEVKFNPDGKLTLFAGKNEQGKTAILKAIESFFQGCNDPDVIRWGADKAEVMIRLDTGIWGKLAVTKSGQKIDVFLNEDGDKKAKPREYLKALLGNHSFDPIGLLTAKDRTKYLMEAFPAPKVTKEMLDGAGIPEDVTSRLDLTKDGFQVLKGAEAIVYERRTNVNARMKQKQGAYDEEIGKLPEEFNPDAFSQETLDIATEAVKILSDSLTSAKTLKEQEEGNQTAVESLKGKIQADSEFIEGRALLDTMESELKNTQERQKEIQEEIASLQRELNLVMGQIQDRTNEIKAVNDARERVRINQEALTALSAFKVPDIAVIEGQLTKARGTLWITEGEKKNHDIFNKAHTEIKPELDRIKAESLTLTAIIEKLREDLPAQLAKEAKIPIKNLRVIGEKAYIGEKSLDNLSGEESVTVALQILRETNKDALLKVFCVDGWEKLDDEHIEAFRQQIKEGEFQFLGTMVQHGDSVPDGAWIMEKGEIKRPKQPQEDTLFEVK
jgi:hypothetical protein